MKHLFRLVLVWCAACITYACSDVNDCSLSGRSMMYCNLYKISGTSVVKDTIDTLTVTALGTDSVLINMQTKVNNFMLPLRYTVDSTVFVFHYAPKSRPAYTDTVCVRHKNTPYFVSMDCGYTVTQIIKSIRYKKTSRIDSIAVANTNPNTDGTENLKIFIRTAN